MSGTENMNAKSSNTCCLATENQGPLDDNSCPILDDQQLVTQESLKGCCQRIARIASRCNNEKKLDMGFTTHHHQCSKETTGDCLLLQGRQHPSTRDSCCDNSNVNLPLKYAPKLPVISTCRSCLRDATSPLVETATVLAKTSRIAKTEQQHSICRNCQVSLNSYHGNYSSSAATTRHHCFSCFGSTRTTTHKLQRQQQTTYGSTNWWLSLFYYLFTTYAWFFLSLLRLCSYVLKSSPQKLGQLCPLLLVLFSSSKPTTSQNTWSHVTFSLSSTTTRCLIFFISLLLCTGSIGAQSWSNPPMDSSALKGSTVTLQCGIKNLVTGRSIQWIQYLGEDTKILFLNGEQFSDDVPDRYSVAPHTAGGPDVSGYDLTLSELVEEDDKVYECAVQLMGEKQAQVTVLVVPGTPVLEVDNISDLTAGDLATLTCTTSGANPQPDITWYRADTEVTGAEVTPPTSKFGTTRSVLTHTLTRHDHLVEFKCSAENKANTGSPVIATEELSVKYAPELDIGPYNPLRVTESSEVTLSCDVDAYPTVTIADVQWLDRSGISLGVGFDYTLQGVDKSHSGKYTCRAENVVDVTLSDVELDVHYGPKVTIHHSRGEMFNSELSINEDTPLNLTCGVDANPSVDLSTIVWKKDNVAVHTGAYYYRSQIQREDTGEYSCTASNTLSPSVGPTEPRSETDSIQVTVHYKPGSATVVVPEDTIKNQRIELTCSVDEAGYPEAVLEWTVLGSSTILHMGPTLTFDRLELSDTNDYICTPTNEVGDGVSDTQKLVVLELPEWIMSLPLKTETIINDTELSIQCEVRGQPRPQVTWFINDQLATQMTNYFTVVEYKKSIDVYSWNVTSVLQWKGYKRSPLETSLLPSDSGMYRCLATSDIGTSPLSSTTQLSVYYPPVVNTTSDKVAADAFGSARLECRAHSLPAASFVWYNGTEMVQSGGRVQISDVEVGGEFPFETSLTISNIQPYDFSTYTCEATNSLGVTERQISLTVKTMPEPPSSLKIHSKTWESVELSWQPGFDGGYAQHFVISYTSATETPGHMTIEGATRANVTMLYPSANYSFQVQGRNQLGTGEMSEMVAAETEFFIIDPPTSIEFDPNTYTVTFDSPSTYYCARIDINDGSRWSNYVQCAPIESGSVQISSEGEVDNLRVALCLVSRQDVCSEPEEAAFLEQEQDLPTYVVIVIGVVCAIIVIALTFVLIYLCIRHNRSSKEEDDKEASNHVGQPAKPLGNGHAKLNSSLDNPSLDGGHRGNNPGYQGDERSHNHSGYQGEERSHGPPGYQGDERSHGSRSPVFTTDTSQGPYISDDYYKQRQLGGGGGVPNGGPPQYHYDNQTNLQREHSVNAPPTNRDVVDGGGHYGVPIKPRHLSDKQYLYEDNHNTTKDSHNNSGEGGSVSSDTKQPKKVMYEVVV